jgi:hypothetical protein
LLKRPVYIDIIVESNYQKTPMKPIAPLLRFLSSIM